MCKMGQTLPFSEPQFPHLGLSPWGLDNPGTHWTLSQGSSPPQTPEFWPSSLHGLSLACPLLLLSFCKKIRNITFHFYLCVCLYSIFHESAGTLKVRTMFEIFLHYPLSYHSHFRWIIIMFIEFLQSFWMTKIGRTNNKECKFSKH